MPTPPSLPEAVAALRAARQREEDADIALSVAFDRLKAHPAYARRPAKHSEAVLAEFYRLENESAEAQERHYAAWREVRTAGQHVIDAALRDVRDEVKGK